MKEITIKVNHFLIKDKASGKTVTVIRKNLHRHLPVKECTHKLLMLPQSRNRVLVDFG